MENSIEVPLKERIELPYDPTIPHLGVYLYKNTNLKKYMHPKLLAALFAVAKVWNQYMCPSIDEYIKKMVCVYVCAVCVYTYTYILCVCTHAMKYYSAVKRKKVCHFQPLGWACRALCK